MATIPPVEDKLMRNRRHYTASVDTMISLTSQYIRAGIRSGGLG
jgi:hypothetical protein